MYFLACGIEYQPCWTGRGMGLAGFTGEAFDFAGLSDRHCGAGEAHVAAAERLASLKSANQDVEMTRFHGLRGKAW